jgi:hypothetical protein
MSLYIIFIISLSIKIVSTQTSCSNFDVGIDRSGPYYTHILTTVTPEACCALCNVEAARCQSWVFVRIGASTSQSNVKILKTRALARNSEKLACTRKNFPK